MLLLGSYPFSCKTFISNMADFLTFSYCFRKVSNTKSAMQGFSFLLLLLVTSVMAQDESIADTCTPLAIIRPAQTIWVARKNTDWADISEIHKQLKKISTIASSLIVNIKAKLAKIVKCNSRDMIEESGYRFLTNDIYSVLLSKKDKIKDILGRLNIHKCYLPEITKGWLERATTFKTKNEVGFNWIAGLSIYVPKSGKTGKVQSLKSEELLSITNHATIGLSSQPTTPIVKMSAFDAGNFSKEGFDNDKLVKYASDDEINYACIQDVVYNDLEDICIVPYKARIEKVLDSGIKAAQNILHWATSLTNRLTSLPLKRVTTVVVGHTVQPSYTLDLVSHHLTRLGNGGMERFGENTEDDIRILGDLSETLPKRVQLDNQRSLVIDNIGDNELPKVNIHISHRVESVDGKQYVYGDIFGPEYNTYYLSPLERLLDASGRVIIFKYLLFGSGDSPVYSALEHHPRDTKGCESFGSQLVCRAPPASGALDSTRCARTLLQLEPNGCGARLYEGKGLKEIMAYCERHPRRYITSPRYVTITHKCRNDVEEKSTYFRGTLRFDDECLLKFNGQPIKEVEEETEWTFDDLKKIEIDLDAAERNIQAGGIFMVIGTSIVLMISGITCCAYLHKNKCQCEPCSSNICNCNCKSFNCFSCCCKKCRKKEKPLGNIAEGVPLTVRDSALRTARVDLS